VWRGLSVPLLLEAFVPAIHMPIMRMGRGVRKRKTLTQSVQGQGNAKAIPAREESAVVERDITMIGKYNYDK
jgi:hypothetical protein